MQSSSSSTKSISTISSDSEQEMESDPKSFLRKKSLEPAERISNKRLTLADQCRLKSVRSRKNLKKERRNRLKTDETEEYVEILNE